MVGFVAYQKQKQIIKKDGFLKEFIYFCNEKFVNLPIEMRYRIIYINSKEIHNF
jgi:hypothetical protein